MSPPTPDEAARHLKIALIREALKAESGNRARAAKRLGYKHPQDLVRAIKALGIKTPKGKPGRPRKRR